jgi:uracil-DNA glycosylase
MGFCFPGSGKSGDLPPRKECAPQWHPKIFEAMSTNAPKLLVGKYAQDYYLQDKKSIVQRCKGWIDYSPEYLVFPHPSPRNNIWLKKNLWFEAEVIPEYKKIVKKLFSGL